MKTEVGLTGTDNSQKFLDWISNTNAGSTGTFENEREALAGVGGFEVTKKAPSDKIVDFNAHFSSY